MRHSCSLDVVFNFFLIWIMVDVSRLVKILAQKARNGALLMRSSPSFREKTVERRQERQKANEVKRKGEVRSSSVGRATCCWCCCFFFEISLCHQSGGDSLGVVLISDGEFGADSGITTRPRGRPLWSSSHLKELSKASATACAVGRTSGSSASTRRRKA